MRRILTAAIALLFLLPAAATAAIFAANREFAIAPMPLDAALAKFAVQSGVDVGTPATGLAHIRSPGVEGRMSAGAALRHLLSGTQYRAIPLTGGGYRIERIPALAPIIPRPPAPIEPALPIIVTASKSDASLLRFPGSVAIIQLPPDVSRGAGANNSLANVAAQAPTIQSTALGAGRNKLFVRGIADSSFLGPTASTTSVYLGDILLAYSGPSPNLTLFDIDRVEIIEGPQGTLYGAGAIGGVIKLTPQMPDLSSVSGSAAVGITATQDGAVGHDEAAMLNIPLLDERIGLRLVAYQSRDGGYVDDSLRGLSDVNRTGTRGGRAALRLAPGDGWHIDLGVVAQAIDSPDSQYALRDLPGLTRRSAIAQPFGDHFLLNWFEVTKTWDSGLRLVSATGLVHDDAKDRFDATVRAAVPLAYDTNDRNSLFTQETRLSRNSSNGDSWLVGAALFRDRDVTSRQYGIPASERDIIGVTNRTINAALFGETTVAITPALAITAGARLTHARIDSEPSATRNASDYVRGHRETRLDPTMGISWLIRPDVALFARYQPGFRTGGLSVAPGIGRVAEFRSDNIHIVEAGVRLERSEELGLSASAAISVADWDHIQADLIDRRGFPFTANVGSGHILGFEGDADWVPIARLHLTGAFFLARTRGDGPDAGLPALRATRLPDTPRFSGDAAIAYDFQWRADRIRLSADARYVGSSFLDPNALLNIRQGNYADLSLTADWQLRPLDLSLAIDNLANSRGDRFALGNPFDVATGQQFTPLRPRNIRLGASIIW